MRPSSAPTDWSALSCFWAPLWIGCYDNAECGMRGAEWLGEVDQRGHRRVRAGTDLPLKFRIPQDRKSTRLNSSHTVISYAVFCLKKKKKKERNKQSIS